MTDNTQTEALLPSRETLMAQAQVFASAWAIAGSRFDSGDGMEVAEQEKAILADMTRRLHARIAELEAQLESIGAGGVSGPLMGQPQAMPDLSALTERGAKAWAGVDAQGLRDGVASAGSEPVAWQYRSVRDKGLWFDCTRERAKQRAAHPETWDVRYLYTHPSPPEGMVGGWTKAEPLIARSLGEWNEDDGPVAWWAWNGHGWAGESPWIGTPLDSDWPDYHTHWTPAPPTPTLADGVEHG